MKIVKAKVAELKEHPKNKEYFQDISGEFWKIFVEDIRENGIREPLTVNSKNMLVIKGNQRLRAAREVGLDDVPCLLIAIDDEAMEVEELIRDNVLRRDIDVFTKFMLVSKLRESVKSRQGKRSNKATSVQNAQKQPPRDQIAEILKESAHFVSMADLFNALPAEKQKEMKDWFYKQDVEPSQKQVKEQLDKLAGKTRDLENALQESYRKNNRISEDLDRINKERAMLAREISSKDKEIKDYKKELAKVAGDKAAAKKIKDDITALSAKRDTFQSELNEISRLVRIKSDVRKLIDALAPVKYSEVFQREGMSPVTKQTVGELLDLVQGWVDDVSGSMKKLKTTIKVK